MFKKKEWRIPQFRNSIESRMRAMCKLVDGGCDDEGIVCEDCLFSEDKLSHGQRRKFKEVWDGLFETKV